MESARTYGDYLNDLVRSHGEQSERSKKLAELSKSDDIAVSKANQLKARLLTGFYDNTAKGGHRSISIYNNPFDEESSVLYNQVKESYGQYEKTWLEVKRGTFLNNGWVDNITGDTLMVTLNW